MCILKLRKYYLNIHVPKTMIISRYKTSIFYYCSGATVKSLFWERRLHFACFHFDQLSEKMSSHIIGVNWVSYIIDEFIQERTTNNNVHLHIRNQVIIIT